MPDSCLFCKIADRKIPADVVFENDRAVAFRDINPQAPVHVLIVPKTHVATVNDLSDDQAPMMGELILIARDLAEQLKIDASGYRLVLNCNAHGGQTVFHLHLHMLGGRACQWPPG